MLQIIEGDLIQNIDFRNEYMLIDKKGKVYDICLIQNSIKKVHSLVGKKVQLKGRMKANKKFLASKIHKLSSQPMEAIQREGGDPKIEKYFLDNGVLLTEG
jgi:hypothetical protein